MTQPDLTPYDTGERCEPMARIASGDTFGRANYWKQKYPDFGKIDFANDEGNYVCTVHVGRTENGRYCVHVVPLCVDDEELDLEISVHGRVLKVSVAELSRLLVDDSR